MKSYKTVLFFLTVIALSGALSWYRDTGYAGPHHDEVIALMAAKGLEREFASLKHKGAPPFHSIVMASEWHRFTKNFKPVSFFEIKQDVQANDKHPPLAFWLFNVWLSNFKSAEYNHAVVLCWLQIILAGILLAFAVLRLIGSKGLAGLAFALFLMGNSAVFTSTWVRQYALFTVWYAAVVVLAGELSRKDINSKSFALLSVAMGGVCLAGMTTHYSFAPASFPIHVALLSVFLWRRKWKRLGVLAGSYILGALAFLFLNAGFMKQVTAVASGIKRSANLDSALVALGGFPQMLVPWPSYLPNWFGEIVGVGILTFFLGLACWLCFLQWENEKITPIRVVLSGMLGTGIVQFLLVALGYFPGWATSPNHTCPFWILCVLVIILAIHRLDRKRLTVSVGIAMIGMLGSQIVFAAHCHRIKSKTNVQYISRLDPSLVYVDNLWRGMILQLTDLMVPNQPVLVTKTENLEKRLKNGDFKKYKTILYLLMGENQYPRKQQTLEAFRKAGWQSKELPVVHPGVYDAIFLEKELQ